MTSGPGPRAANSSCRNSCRARVLTLGLSARYIRRQAAASHIHWGISSERVANPGAACSVTQRKTARLSLMSVSTIHTERLCHGCHGYRTSRASVLWVFGCRLVQRGPSAPEPELLDPDRIQAAPSVPVAPSTPSRFPGIKRSKFHRQVRYAIREVYLSATRHVMARRDTRWHAIRAERPPAHFLAAHQFGTSTEPVYGPARSACRHRGRDAQAERRTGIVRSR